MTYELPEGLLLLGAIFFPAYLHHLHNINGDRVEHDDSIVGRVTKTYMIQDTCDRTPSE